MPQMYEIDWKTMTAKHLEVRKAVSSDFKTFTVLYFLFVCFLCLHKLNVDTSVSALNKKTEGLKQHKYKEV